MKTALKTALRICSLVLVFSCNPGNIEKENDKVDSLNVSHNNIADEKVVAAASVNCVNLTLTEDEIDMTPYIKQNSAGVSEQANFSNYFRYHKVSTNTKEPLNQEPVKINMAYIVQMYNQVKTQDANIRGLKVSLGLIDDKVKFMLTNVLMKCSRTATVQDNYYKYVPTEIGSYYLCKGDGTTETVSANDFNSLCAEYLAKIRIKHKATDGNYTAMDFDPPSWKNDTKEIIFSYQELFHYYHIAYPCSAGKNDYNKDLFLYNGSDPKGDGEQVELKRMEEVNKHTIFITSEPLTTKKTFSILVAGDIANLAHLCPPSCYPIYKILSKNTTCINP